jgi:transcriptional regulator with GAF, ATPase, and Fis domain
MPLVEVNCASIPSELIESELFGHEKGSFTSAIKQRIGKFEQAHGGTLFLDEIGDMSMAAQAKVLRAIQEGRITRVGGDREIKVDVRIVAATNKNLLEEIEKGNANA